MSDRFEGFVDVKSVSEGKATFSGWCFSKIMMKSVPMRFLSNIDSTESYLDCPIQARPDVSKFFNSSNLLNSGFSITIPLSSFIVLTLQALDEYSNWINVIELNSDMESLVYTNPPVFTQDWSTFFEQSLKSLFPTPIYNTMTCLEIGSFEGRGTLMMIDKLCKHPNSKVYCVDPWNDAYVAGSEVFKEWDDKFIGQFERFKHNTKDYNDKIISLRGCSNEMISQIPDASIDFAFIDGDRPDRPDRPAHQVYLDGKLTLRCMKPGGIIIFDDYLWKCGTEVTAIGVDKFVEEFSGQVEVIQKNDQLVIKVKDFSVPKEAIFHVYAFCFNESRILPAFLHHYRNAERIVILDNESTDGSPDIVRSAGREVITFKTDNKMDDRVHRDFRNFVWKRSCGVADFVFMGDMDEFINFSQYPNDLISGFGELKNNGVTAVKFQGYDIVCTDEEFESAVNSLSECSLVSQINNGYRVGSTAADKFLLGCYDKTLVFNPNKIKETGFSVGGHYCTFSETAVFPKNINDYIMLHYHHTGFLYEKERMIMIRDRQSKVNIDNGWTTHYSDKNEVQEMKLVKLYQDEEHNIVSLKNVLFPGLINTKVTNTTKNFLVSPWSDDCLSQAIISGQVWEPLVAQLISKLCKPEYNITFLDIGSNIGVHGFASLQSGAKKLIAFECHPTTYEKLVKGIKANGWSSKKALAIKGAVSNTVDHEEVFMQVNGNLGASYIQSTHIGWPGAVLFSEKVKTITLDTYSKTDLSLMTENVIAKLDVEGHEAEVLLGMKDKWLQPDSPLKVLLVELNPYTKSVNDIINHVIVPLYKAGYINIRIIMDVPRDPWWGAAMSGTALSVDEKTTFETEVRNLLISMEMTDIEDLRIRLNNRQIIEAMFTKIV